MNNRKKQFEHVFLDQRWGNASNAGKNYVRPYSKTNGKAKDQGKEI